MSVVRLPSLGPFPSAAVLEGHLRLHLKTHVGNQGLSCPAPARADTPQVKGTAPDQTALTVGEAVSKPPHF